MSEASAPPAPVSENSVPMAVPVMPIWLTQTT